MQIWVRRSIFCLTRSQTILSQLTIGVSLPWCRPPKMIPKKILFVRNSKFIRIVLMPTRILHCAGKGKERERERERDRERGGRERGNQRERERERERGGGGGGRREKEIDRESKSLVLDLHSCLKAKLLSKSMVTDLVGLSEFALKVRGQNSHRKTVKETVEDGQKSRWRRRDWH